MEGIRVAIAGRSIPSIDLSTNFAVAIAAPVFHALTTASASPVAISSTATFMEEFFF